MTAQSAAVQTTMKIASIQDLSLRVVINGEEVTVSAFEVDPFRTDGEKVTDYAVAELRKLRDRLNEFSDAVVDHRENGGFPADFPMMSEVEKFCRDHIWLTRCSWRTLNRLYYAQALKSNPRNVWLKDELSRVAWARATRVRVHLRKTKAKLCPPIVAEPEIASTDQHGLHLNTGGGQPPYQGLLKTPIEHVLRLLNPRPKTIRT